MLKPIFGNRVEAKQGPASGRPMDQPLAELALSAAYREYDADADRSELILNFVKRLPGVIVGDDGKSTLRSEDPREVSLQQAAMIFDEESQEFIYPLGVDSDGNVLASRSTQTDETSGESQPPTSLFVLEPEIGDRIEGVLWLNTSGEKFKRKLAGTTRKRLKKNRSRFQRPTRLRADENTGKFIVDRDSRRSRRLSFIFGRFGNEYPIDYHRKEISELESDQVAGFDVSAHFLRLATMDDRIRRLQEERLTAAE